MLTLIAAASENNALGKDNHLVWHLPDDFKRFQALTSGHYIIMGRRTFESLDKPLPNRTNVIITRQKDYKAPKGCIVVHNLSKAIECSPKDEDVFVIGGGQIYKESIKIADKVELTRVHTTVEADTFFPEIDEEVWKVVESVYHPIDERHKYDFTYLTFVKR